jgi:hypothetical protein
MSKDMKTETTIDNCGAKSLFGICGHFVGFAKRCGWACGDLQDPHERITEVHLSLTSKACTDGENNLKLEEEAGVIPERAWCIQSQ